MLPCASGFFGDWRFPVPSLLCNVLGSVKSSPSLKEPSCKVGADTKIFMAK